MGKTGLIVVLVILLLVGGAYFFITNGKIPNPLSQKSESPSLGEQIYAQTKNPLEEKLPETNPFAVETNPVKAIYPNPFK